MRRTLSEKILRTQIYANPTQINADKHLRPSALHMRESALLFEIGTEEMPVGCILGCIEQLRHIVKPIFTSYHIFYDEKGIEVYATPRRIVLYVKKVSQAQTLLEPVLIIGPSRQAAFDKEGKPTPAYTGFAKSQKVDLEDVKIKSMPKGEYLCVIKEPKSERTLRLLPKILQALIEQFRFQRTMRWDSAAFRFPRPIRWLLAIYDDKLIKFRYGAVKSENITFINRNPFKIKNIDDYFRKIKASGILIDANRRKEHIKAKIGAGRSSSAWDDRQEELLTEVTFLTERPCVFAGRFNAKYSKELPGEILSACLSKYQRLFGASGRPRFFGVADGSFNKKTLAGIRKNYEYVLEARLKDALFFYNEDLEIKLDKRVDMLKGIVFLEGLGSMYEKTQRIAHLTELIARELGLAGSEKDNALRSAMLSKTDLTTLMVKEFPGLQGVVGSIYARAQGENDEISEAIRQHYLPRGLGNEMPTQTMACIVSTADKLDTLIGCFAIGLEPTGSEDPYGLKRCANGIISIAVNRRWRLSLDQLMNAGTGLFKGQLKLGSAALSDKLKNYLMTRFEEFCANSFQKDIICSVTTRSFDDIYSSWQRCHILNRIRNEDYFKKACKVAERTNNILKGVKDEIGAVDASRFCEPLEGKLWLAYENNRARIEEAVKQDKYEDATRFYGEAFFGIINEFFDKVLVNVEDESIRRNRLGVMKAIRDLYATNVADLSRIALE